MISALVLHCPCQFQVSVLLYCSPCLPCVPQSNHYCFIVYSCYSLPLCCRHICFPFPLCCLQYIRTPGFTMSLVRLWSYFLCLPPPMPGLWHLVLRSRTETSVLFTKLTAVVIYALVKWTLQIRVGLEMPNFKRFLLKISEKKRNEQGLCPRVFIDACCSDSLPFVQSLQSTLAELLIACHI